MLSALGVAAQLAIMAHAPDTVRACDAVEITVALRAPGPDVPRLTAPSFRPFDVLRAGALPRVSRDAAGRGSVVAEYRWVVTVDRPGRYVVPPFEAHARGGVAASRPLAITVLPMRPGGAPSIVARARIDTAGDANVSPRSADTVFIGQQATYEVAVFLNKVMRERLRRNPTFYPPEMRAMLAYDLPAAGPGFWPVSASGCFDALIYRRAVFPLVAGRLVIPPAQLVYNTALSSTSLFSREESHELETDSVSITAIEPPATGRPVEYGGAVGDVRVEARLDSVESRVGDPMLYTVRVVGSGNVKLFPRPVIRIPWAGVVAADERVAVDSGSARVGGAKEFDWVLTPRLAGEFDVPPVRYGYFDPGHRRYAVAVSGGDRLRVAAGALANVDTGQAEGPLAIRTEYSGPAPGSPQSSPVFWLVLALVPVPALVARRRRAPRPSPSVAIEPMRALADAAMGEDPVALRRLYVRVLAQRLGCAPSDFTHSGALHRALRRAGVSESTAARAELHLRELDAAAYGRGSALQPHMARTAHALAQAVDSEALSRGELPYRLPVVLLTLIAAGAVAAAMAADTASTSFARGVSSYLRDDFAVARLAFAAAASVAPRAPDAWANYGTASWATGDTASAVYGWRAALALEPNAGDARARLSLARPVVMNAPGWLPALPADFTVWAFAAMWVGAWAAAWSARGVPGRMARRTLPLAVLSLCTGLAAIEIDARVAGTDTAVVRRAQALVSDPAIGMDRGPGVGTGEMVRVVARRADWVRIAATDARAGWVPADQLLFLADRRPPRD